MRPCLPCHVLRYNRAVRFSLQPHGSDDSAWPAVDCSAVALSWPISVQCLNGRRDVRMAYSSLIGARVKRKEDPRLITGKGTYVGDMKLAGMQYVAFVRSPYAHARITAIETAAAQGLPGVLAVVTG